MNKTDKFIDKAAEIHGNKYDYSLTEYTKSTEKVKIICKEHGVFEQRANYHLDKCGCPMCGKTLKLTNEIFINRASILHKKKYDYSLVEYKGDKTKIKIICKEHGIFEQRPSHHLNNSGCPKCNIKIDITLLLANNPGSKYKENERKIELMCKEHGNFTKTIYSKNFKCRKCARKKENINKKDKCNIFIEKAKELNGNLYDYSNVKYITCEKKVEIICQKHGIFLQTPIKHLRGQQCSYCRTSHGETLIKKLLEENNLKYKPQYTFSDLKNKRTLYFDFGILDGNNTLKCLIEYNGIQHYRFTKRFHKTEQEFFDSKYRDNLKIDYCLKNNIKLFIIKYNEEIINKMANILEYILNEFKP